MNIMVLEILCDMPNCLAVFRGQFVTNEEKTRLLSMAKRDGWRTVRIGDQMADVCDFHPEII